MMALMIMRVDADCDDGDAGVIFSISTLEGHTSCRVAVRDRRLRLAFEDQFQVKVEGAWRYSCAVLRSPFKGLYHREPEVPLSC